MNTMTSKFFIGLLLVSMTGAPMYAAPGQAAQNQYQGFGLFTAFKNWIDGIIDRHTRVDASFALPAITVVASGVLLVGFLKSFKASSKRTAREQEAEAQRTAQNQPGVRQSKWQKIETNVKNAIVRWRMALRDGFQGLFNVANVPLPAGAGQTNTGGSNVLTPEQLLNAAAAGSRTAAGQNAESLFA